jgi:exo-1,4-beta-D-glucosaminidase
MKDLWAKPDAPQFHAGTPGTAFETLAIFNQALAQRLGKPTSLEDYVRKAQLMNYEAERAQFEAYGLRKYTRATGVVHWLLNNPWPSLIWHLYDHGLVPAAGFYGAKKANEPLHAVYNYADRGIVVVNNNMKTEAGLTVVARLIDREGVERSAQTMTVEEVEADGVVRVGAIPRPGGLSGAYFVDLELRRGADVLSTNTYWLSTRSDVSDHDAASWLHTPTTQLADFKDLTKLPAATLKVTVKRGAGSPRPQFLVTLENRGKTVAFFTRMTLRKSAGGSAVAPVFWDDNYVTLRPGAGRTFVASIAAGALEGAAPVIEVEGVNVARVIASVR